MNKKAENVSEMYGPDVESFDEFGFAVFTSTSKERENEVCHIYNRKSTQTPGDEEIDAWTKLFWDWDRRKTVNARKLTSFIKDGVPNSMRAGLWQRLLETKQLKAESVFCYKMCVFSVRHQLVDVGISEYGGNDMVAHLCEVESNTEQAEKYRQPGQIPLEYLRQILLDLDRSYPTNKMFMGQTTEAREGRAALFRVLAVYASYNPAVGYCQGMAYIAGMFLMHMCEEEAFWCLAALMGRKKYLLGYYSDTFSRVQCHAAVFQRLIKQRLPLLNAKFTSVGLEPLMFITPWFLCLYTNLPCWDSVLAIWDLLLLQGISTVLRVGQAILNLCCEQLLACNSMCTILPLLLHLPSEICCHERLIPEVWSVEVESWEVESLIHVLEEENKPRTLLKRKHLDSPSERNAESAQDFFKFTAGLDSPLKSKRRKTELGNDGMFPSMLKRFINIFTPKSEELGQSRNLRTVKNRRNVIGPKTSSTAWSVYPGPHSQVTHPRSAPLRKRHPLAPSPPSNSDSPVMTPHRCTETEIPFSRYAKDSPNSHTPLRRSPRLIARREVLREN